MSQVWDLQTESHTQKLVLLALADNANDAGICWPSIATLARKTQMSEQGVRNQIKGLIAIGWVSVKARFDDAGDRASNLYDIHLEGGQPRLPQVVNGVRDGGQPDVGQVVNRVHPEPSVEPSRNHQGGETPKFKKYPSEAFKAMKLIEEDLRDIKESGSRSKWRDTAGALTEAAKAEVKRLRELLAKNKEIACR